MANLTSDLGCPGKQWHSSLKDTDSPKGGYQNNNLAAKNTPKALPRCKLTLHPSPGCWALATCVPFSHSVQKNRASWLIPYTQHGWSGHSWVLPMKNSSQKSLPYCTKQVGKSWPASHCTSGCCSWWGLIFCPLPSSEWCPGADSTITDTTTVKQVHLAKTIMLDRASPAKPQPGKSTIPFPRFW